MFRSIGSMNYGMVSFLIEPKSGAYNFQGQPFSEIIESGNIGQSQTNRGTSSFINSMEVKPNNTIVN